jgi:hypothetical protein
MKNYLPVILIILVVSFVMYSLTSNKNTASTASGIYCSSDGTLTNTKSIQSHRSYCVQQLSEISAVQASSSTAYSFKIIDDQGNTLKDFQMEHEKLLHLIVVRKDLNEFQHVHPTLDATTGIFTLSDLTFPSSGAYRIFADFTPISAQMDASGQPMNVVSSEDMAVAGAYSPQPLGTTETTKTFDGYMVTLTTDPKAPLSGTVMLMFAISKNGKPVADLQDYLGALGHSVILKEKTLDYIHTHAIETPSSKQNGTITFHVEFPSAGNYKVFMQFQDQGKVTTTNFVVPITQGAGTIQSTTSMYMMPDGSMIIN